VPAVDEYLIAEYLGRADDAEFAALCEQFVAIVTAMVSAYTRGRGFVGGVPTDDLTAVIVTSTARLISNPTNDTSEQLGGYVSRPGTLDGWTLPELAVLNRYRVRAG